MFKKYLSCLFVLCYVIVLVGCTDTENRETDESIVNEGSIDKLFIKDNYHSILSSKNNNVCAEVIKVDDKELYTLNYDNKSCSLLVDDGYLYYYKDDKCYVANDYNPDEESLNVITCGLAPIQRNDTMFFEPVNDNTEKCKVLFNNRDTSYDGSICFDNNGRFKELSIDIDTGKYKVTYADSFPVFNRNDYTVVDSDKDSVINSFKEDVYCFMILYADIKVSDEDINISFN